MYVSSAPPPYDGVYQRQPTGLPKAEFIPQYPPMPSAPLHQANSANMYPQMPNGFQAPMQYPPQSAYQDNSYGGQMYVPQMNSQQVRSFLINFSADLINSFSIRKCRRHMNNLNKMCNGKSMTKREFNLALHT